MHKVDISSWAVERALARRGRLRPFAARTTAAPE
jgi:hypothetical protein